MWTGAGISACLDLALALIADDLGEVAALHVARQLVMYVKRPSGQSQFSVPLEQVATTRRTASACGFGTVDTLVRAFRRRFRASYAG